jgi:hypothetical protein
MWWQKSSENSKRKKGGVGKDTNGIEGRMKETLVVI